MVCAGISRKKGVEIILRKCSSCHTLDLRLGQGVAVQVDDRIHSRTHFPIGALFLAKEWHVQTVPRKRGVGEDKRLAPDVEHGTESIGNHVAVLIRISLLDPNGVVPDLAAEQETADAAGAVEERLNDISTDLAVDNGKARAGVGMEKVETGPTVRILRIFTDAAVDDPAVEETDVFAGIGLDAAVGAIADGSADSDQIAAVGGGDAQCSTAVEVTEVDGDLTAAVEAQYAAGAIALLDGMADPEAGEIKVFAAGKAQDVGIAGLGDDAAVCKAAALQKQVPDLIKGLGDLLEGNRTTINDSDQKLAEAISGGQG